ncbi:hypothetical protein Poli38472_005574 [Pythium oligandrum]|uniref:Aminotransferase class I/classII large domain-containing protein n=1 Tax=Pythium oligandrum TaxID=41045 RepID=A0A8K1FHP2_PYTOL|nr:hypothetical protein Poli38472_005574 [Pythium oligandrum]|eukprot:TMW62956.1 hypothetical protein Poli38472_005574 [Pythium oligandrum]
MSISVQDSPYAQTHTTVDVINFGLGQPSKALLPLELFEQAAQQRFGPRQDRAMLQYGAGKGYSGFRSVLAGFLSEAYGYPVESSGLMVTAGNSQAISHAAIAFAGDRKRAFVEEPTYFLAFDIFRELGMSLESIPVGAHGLNLDALEDRLRSEDVPSFLYTVPFHHNPTGAVLSSDRCEHLVQLAQQYDFRIISDEPYNLLSHTGENHRSLASYDTSGRVVSLGSFSKILAPGLRLGWMESSTETIDQLASCGVIRSGGGQNPMTAALVHTIVEQGKLQLHIDRLKQTFESRKLVMCNALHEHCKDAVFTEPDGGYFVWIKLPVDMSAVALLEESSKNHGVAFTPGSRCSLNSDARESASEFIRLSFAFYDEDEIHEGGETTAVNTTRLDTLHEDSTKLETSFRSALKGEFAAINAKIDSMHECTTDRDASLLSLLNDMKDEMLAMKNEISGVKIEMLGMKSEMSGVRNEMAGLHVEYRRFDARVHNWQAACHNIKAYREGRTTMSFAPFKKVNPGIGRPLPGYIPSADELCVPEVSVGDEVPKSMFPTSPLDAARWTPMEINRLAMILNDDLGIFSEEHADILLWRQRLFQFVAHD